MEILAWLIAALAFISLLALQKRVSTLERALYGVDDGKGMLPRVASLEASRMIDSQRLRQLEGR